MNISHVRTREGTTVPFDQQRITDAVARAFSAEGKPSANAFEQAETVSNLVLQRLYEYQQTQTGAWTPDIELIQDAVESALLDLQYHDVAKRYIRYRTRHSEYRSRRHKEVAERASRGELQVLSSEGKVQDFSLSVLRTYLQQQIQLLPSETADAVDPEFILDQVILNLFDGITPQHLRRLLLQASSSFIEIDPGYEQLSALLLRQDHYNRLLGCELTTEQAQINQAYRDHFTTAIGEGVRQGYFTAELTDFDLDRLAAGLQPERDAAIGFMGLQTLSERYLVLHQDQPLESFQGFWMRVAMGLALNESQREQRALEFYRIMAELRFIPSTPTLFHAGLVHPQLSSCYLSTIEDDLSHIFKVMGDNAALSKWSGGIGTDWSNIRATGAHIKSTRVQSQGVVPFLKIANDVTVAINRSGKRRGAACAYLETWHFDIEEFLDLRRNTGDDRRRTHDMNTANWIPDLFMKRVAADAQWTLFSPDEVPDLHHSYGRDFEERYTAYEAKAERGEIAVFKTVEAKKLWRKMLTRLFETGHPWITFKDPSNIRSPQDHVGVVHSSNLCTEITLNTSNSETAVCNLGSINLAEHTNTDGQFGLQEQRLLDTINTAVRMLDNVIDLNYYPTEEARLANMRHRPVGLGLMGLQDALLQHGLGFEDARTAEFVDASMEFIAYHTIAASSSLAAERGSYQSFPGSKWDRGIFPLDTIDLLEQERGVPVEVNRDSRLDWDALKATVAKQGMRNSNTMAIAPTATISTIAGCYPCIEPAYKNIYVKSNMTGEFTVINRYLVQELKTRDLWDADMLDQLKYNDGSLQRIASIPAELHSRFKEAFEVDPKVLIELTALRSKWIDQSQSHNMFVHGTSGRLLEDIYSTAWRKGLKTTYYLRSLAASQIEKSTLNAKQFGYTQQRPQTEPATAVAAGSTGAAGSSALCRIEDPDCEACQ